MYCVYPRYSRCVLGISRHARRGRFWSLVAAGLMNMTKVIVPISTHNILVM